MLAFWAILQSSYPVFDVPEEITKAIHPFPSEEELVPFHAAAAKADLENLMLFFGLLGAFPDGLLGIGVGVAQRSLIKALACGAVSAAMAAVFGGVAGLLGHYCFGGASREWASVFTSIGIHSAMFALIGGGTGMGLGLSAGCPRMAGKGLLAGLLAGAMAGALYPFVAALLMPLASTECLIPDRAAARLLWIALPATLVALVVPMFLRRRPAGD